MHKYEVTTACYVPVGPGFKYKKAGQVVTLDDVDAAELAPFLTRLGIEGLTGTVIDGVLDVEDEPDSEGVQI